MKTVKGVIDADEIVPFSVLVEYEATESREETGVYRDDEDVTFTLSTWDAEDKPVSIASGSAVVIAEFYKKLLVAALNKLAERAAEKAKEEEEDV